MQKHLSRARQWALVDGGKGGGERGQREGESTDKYTQLQTRHNKTQTTQGKEKNTTRGILRSSKAAVRIFVRGGSGVYTYIIGRPLYNRVTGDSGLG